MHRVDISNVIAVGRLSLENLTTKAKRTMVLIEFKMTFGEASKSGSLNFFRKIVKNSSLVSIILNILIFVFSAQSLEILTRFIGK